MKSAPQAPIVLRIIMKCASLQEVPDLFDLFYVVMDLSCQSHTGQLLASEFHCMLTAHGLDQKVHLPGFHDFLSD